METAPGATCECQVESFVVSASRMSDADNLFAGAGNSSTSNPWPVKRSNLLASQILKMRNANTVSAGTVQELGWVKSNGMISISTPFNSDSSEIESLMIWTRDS